MLCDRFKANPDEVPDWDASVFQLLEDERTLKAGGL